MSDEYEGMNQQQQVAYEKGRPLDYAEWLEENDGDEDDYQGYLDRGVW